MVGWTRDLPEDMGYSIQSQPSIPEDVSVCPMAKPKLRATRSTAGSASFVGYAALGVYDERNKFGDR